MMTELEHRLLEEVEKRKSITFDKDTRLEVASVLGTTLQSLADAKNALRDAKYVTEVLSIFTNETNTDDKYADEIPVITITDDGKAALHPAARKPGWKFRWKFW